MRYISDMGGPVAVTTIARNDDKEVVVEEVTNIGRYGVWAWDESKHKFQVIACGDDLDGLQRKYGPDLQVSLMGGP